MKGGTTVADTVFDGYLGPRLERSAQLRRVRNVIRCELTPRQREIVERFYTDGQTVTKIAAELGVNKSTVSRTLARARRKLRMCLRY